MKQAYYILLFISLSLVSCNTKNSETSNKSASDNIQYSYKNPLPIEFGDPFVLNSSDSLFYMYGTSGINGFKAYSSKDLSTWSDLGVVYEGAKEGSWAVNCFWAPEVYERNGKYYLFFSANWVDNPNNEDENFRIGVAVSNSPSGPFVDMFGAPLFDPGYPVIDANVYFDDENNKAYLYYSRCCYKHPVESEIADWAKKKGWFEEIEESWIYGVELNADFSGIIGEPQVLLRPPVEIDDKQAEWESRSVTSHEINRRWTEGSFTFKKGDTYYIMYSANYFGGSNYAVGYATSKSPLGPFIKSENNPVLQRNDKSGGDVTGTGHCMVFNIDSERQMCVYHGRTKNTGDERVVFMDYLRIEKDGTLIVDGPTTN